MSSNISSQNTGSGGDTITLQIGTRKIEVSEAFAKSLDSKFDAISAGVDSSGRYSSDDRLYQDIQRTVETLNLANSRAADSSNPDRIDSSGRDYLIDLTSKLVSTQRNAEVPTAGDEERGDAAKVKEMVDWFRGAFDDGMEAKYPSPPQASLVSDTSSSGGGSASQSGGSVISLLDEADSADNLSDKVSLVSDAVAALIAQLRGGGSGGSSEQSSVAKETTDTLRALRDGIAGESEDSSGSSDTADALISNLTGLQGAIGGRPASQGNDLLNVGNTIAETKDSADDEPVEASGTSRTYAGDELMSKVVGIKANMPDFLAGLFGAQDNRIMGKVTYEKEDQGVGIGDDEIGRGEKMIFTPAGPATSGSVELVDLFGSERGGPENAKITVMKDGEEVGVIPVRGTGNGNVTVPIEQEFDELVFTPGAGRNSDFAIKSVTTNTGEASDAPVAEDPPKATLVTDRSDPVVNAPSDVDAPADADAPSETSQMTWSASLSYDAHDSLTVQYKDVEGNWVDLDTKPAGGVQGLPAPADFTTDGLPELRVRNNSNPQMIKDSGETDDQFDYVMQADGSIIISVDDRIGGDGDMDDVVITLTPNNPVADGGDNPVADDADSVDGPDEAGDDATLVSDTSNDSVNFNFDNKQLLSLIDALIEAVGVIDKDGGLSSAEKDALFEDVNDIIASIAGGLAEGGEDGADVTIGELSGMLRSVAELTDQLDATDSFDTDTADVRDALIDGAADLDPETSTDGDAAIEAGDVDDALAEEEAVLI